MTILVIEDGAFEYAVRHYHRSIYHSVTDYTKVVENKTTTVVNGTTLYVFEAPGQTIYLDGDGYPVTIGNQMIDSQQKAYYYRRNTNEDYEYICPYEWMKKKQPWQPW